MKAYCDICYANPNRDLDFSVQHLFNPISSIFNCYEGRSQIETDTTHCFILDIDINLEHYYLTYKQLRDLGIRVVAFSFDPANFIRLRKYVDEKCIDKVIVFDKKFENRFSCPTFVSDYFFNENLFPVDNGENNGKVCFYGRQDNERPNNYNLDIVDNGVSSLSQIYTNIQKYNGVATYDTGWNETFTETDHYNKARGTETLMCGRIPYCKPGINTKRYNKFLKKYDEIPNPSTISFEQKQIFDINKLTLEELKFELENLK